MLNNNEKKLSLNCDGQQIPPLSIKLIIKWIMVSTIYIFFKVITFVGWFIYGVLRHFQHYFINQSINSISVILVAETRTTRRKPPICHKSLTTIKFNSRIQQLNIQKTMTYAHAQIAILIFLSPCT